MQTGVFAMLHSARFAMHQPERNALIYKESLTACNMARSLNDIYPPTTADGKEWKRMLYYALVFLIVAIIAGVLGFGGLAGAAATIAKILFIVFLVLFVISLFRGRRRV